MKQVAIKNFTEFTGKDLCQSFFFNNVAGKGDYGTGVFL